jgi:8-oxo-dGTP diphosphatase
VEWVDPHAFGGRQFPAANLPVTTAARLPETYLITPEPGGDDEAFLDGLEAALLAGVQLVQLRAPAVALVRYRRLARAALERCRDAGAALLLNADPARVAEVEADGVHLTAARLAACRERPLGRDRWVAASCHDAAELEHARQVGVDFVVVSPVRVTPSHPGAPALGWHRLWALTEAAAVPVYALGGLGPADLPMAWAHGAQGIAAIRGLWRDKWG